MAQRIQWAGYGASPTSGVERVGLLSYRFFMETGVERFRVVDHEGVRYVESPARWRVVSDRTWWTRRGAERELARVLAFERMAAARFGHG